MTKIQPSSSLFHQIVSALNPSTWCYIFLSQSTISTLTYNLVMNSLRTGKRFIWLHSISTWECTIKLAVMKLMKCKRGRLQAKFMISICRQKPWQEKETNVRAKKNSISLLNWILRWNSYFKSSSTRLKTTSTSTFTSKSTRSCLTNCESTSLCSRILKLSFNLRTKSAAKNVCMRC